MSNGWEVWARRTDDQVIEGMQRLGDYTEEGQEIIRAEMRRRRLTIPHPGIHVYRVKNPAGGLMDIVSVLPEGVVFTRGSVIEAVVGRLRKSTDEGGGLTPDNFDANPLFADYLHDAVARYCPTQSDLIEEAKRIGRGKVYVTDGRTPTPQGAVPAHDIMGSFDIDEGVVLAGSYQRNPNYTVLSADGFFRMDWAFHELIAAELAERKLPVRAAGDST